MKLNVLIGYFSNNINIGVILPSISNIKEKIYVSRNSINISLESIFLCYQFSWEIVRDVALSVVFIFLKLGLYFGCYGVLIPSKELLTILNFKLRINKYVKHIFKSYMFLIFQNNNNMYIITMAFSIKLCS